MTVRRRILRAALLVVFAMAMALGLAPRADATVVTVDFGVPGGWYNDGEFGSLITFTSNGGDAAITIKGVKLSVSGTLLYDTVGWLSRAFTVTNGSGGAVGFTATSPSPVADTWQRAGFRDVKERFQASKGRREPTSRGTGPYPVLRSRTRTICGTAA